ncbi:MAG: glycosyltransferase [Desulfovibrio sp.]|jgi:glycosyltransferase involved in cell wall biosynthesis|nr:glycosyltransferase [Desulfovibrio sp.]
MRDVVINFTMPVFNRLTATQRALAALWKSDRSIPFSITVVDNGSEAELVDKLRKLHKDGIIDKLFLLPKNMGIACACNIGWEMTPAPFYCKIDNDTAPVRKDWIASLFRLWRHGKSLSTLGYAATKERLLREFGAMHTEDGILGICRENLAGTGIFIPKAVSDILGYWNEEYGLYGAEDGDYGLRMQCADFPQYYYYGPDYICYDLDRTDEAQYMARGVNKKKEHTLLFGTNRRPFGTFSINQYLYHMCIRSWNVKRRYYIKDIDSKCRVDIAECEDYAATRIALMRCGRLLEKSLAQKKGYVLDDRTFIEQLKKIMESCGQSLNSFN